jgi:hypothetical protein
VVSGLVSGGIKLETCEIPSFNHRIYITNCDDAESAGSLTTTISLTAQILNGHANTIMHQYSGFIRALHPIP